MSLEPYLIEQCSPTLASIKTGSLFRVPYPSDLELEASLNAMKEPLQAKGISLEILRKETAHVLLYLYRYRHLERDLQKEGVAEFLQQNGYEDCSVEAALGRLKQRFAGKEGFPHEIGLFLSYPLIDVVGFIENKGHNCKYCGIWKVYGDEHEARKKFAQFNKCSAIYRRQYAQGKSLWKLTVAQ